jgi:hypothetical protein
MLPERIESKIMPEPNSGCWIWLAYLAPFGHGRIKFEGRMREAHRVVYELIKGPVPEGLELDHLCKLPCCVNPDHLEPVTHAVNMRRSKPGQKTHCINGHEYNEKNTYWWRGTSRHCRACDLERHRKETK